MGGIFINNLEQGRVLIVDDEIVNIKVLAQMLKGLQLSVAKDGESALEIAKSNPPDLILLDIMMPGIDGYQVCKELKESVTTRDIPIIFITAKGSEEDEVYGLKLGAIDYITKPFTPVLVKTKVRNHIKHQRTKKELRKFSKVVEQSSLGIVITDIKGKVDYINSKITKITGYSLDEFRGKNPNILKTNYHTASYYEDLWSTITSGKEWEGEFYNRRKDGSFYWERAKITPLFDQSGKIEAFIGMKEDITKEKELKDKLQFLAQRDYLTEVYNRRVGYEILEEKKGRVDREGGSFSIAFIDINNLKIVNDLYGHDIGDEFIVKVVEVIKRFVRDEDRIARFGGDEFIIVFDNIKKSEVEEILIRIQNRLEAINDSDEYNYNMSISYGIEDYFREKNIVLDELISMADAKMYNFKKKYKKELELPKR